MVPCSTATLTELRAHQIKQYDAFQAICSFFRSHAPRQEAIKQRQLQWLINLFGITTTV
jgi:hypothetical protein